jgi:nucleotide-binding universal stress UspA family protein
MKAILVATDFTEASSNACRYGVDLANYLNTKVILFNAYQLISAPAFDTPVYIDSGNAKELANRQLLDQARELNVSHTPDFYLDCNEGPVVDSIIRKVKEVKADLVVTGMKHDHKEFRKIFGSTVAGLINKSPVPVIVVPEGVKFQNIATTALAFESDVDAEGNPHILDTLHEIAEHFHSRVYMVKVSKNKLQEAFSLLHKPYRLTKMMGNTDPLFESISNKNVEGGLLTFVQNYNVNLLALMPHRNSPIQRLIKMSLTRKMIFDANLPLLILPDIH